jgi:hypothetical protein
LINELVLTKISGNIQKLRILHGFYHKTYGSPAELYKGRNKINKSVSPTFPG